MTGISIGPDREQAHPDRRNAMTESIHIHRRHRMKRPAEKGFTLLEVMIAVSILAVTLVAVFQAQSQSVSMSGNARFLTTAALLAQGKMAEMEAAGMQQMKTESGDFGEDFPDYEWRMNVRETEIQALGKVEFTVTHKRMKRNNTYMLEYFRFMPR